MHPLTKAEVIKTYDRWAPAYDATFGRIVGHYHRHIGKFVRNVGARRVLEIGVGTGLSLQHYPAGASVIGVDICPRMLANARKRVDAGTAADVELQLVDGEALPFADGSFDAVVLPFVISVTPDPDRLLSEVFRVLRPGSPAMLLNHFAGVRGLRWMERLFSPFAKFVGFESNLDLGTLLERSAMRVESVQHLRPLGFFTLVTLRKP